MRENHVNFGGADLMITGPSRSVSLQIIGHKAGG